MVNHCQLIYCNKYLALMSLYGVWWEADQGRGWTGPLSFKQYLRLMLQHNFWGDKIILYVVSCMWSLKIIVFNMRILQEYMIQHELALDLVDVIVTYNASNHFNAAGG